MFASYEYHQPADQEIDEDGLPFPCTFEVHLQTRLQAMDIFGGAGPAVLPKPKTRRSNAYDDDDDTQRGEDSQARFRRPSSKAPSEKKAPTTMRLSYAGEGEKLILLCGLPGEARLMRQADRLGHGHPLRARDVRAGDDARPRSGRRRVSAHDRQGASTIAEGLRWQSDLLRDAFSELDSSCDRITFGFFADRNDRAKDDDPQVTTARFRLEAQGSGGSTEVCHSVA